MFCGDKNDIIDISIILMGKVMHKKTEKIVMSWGVFGTAAVGVAAMASSVSMVYADNTISATQSANASVTVVSSCNLTSTVNVAHSATIGNNAVVPATEGGAGVGQTTLKVNCNDPSGFAIYAVGYSGDEYGNNNLIGNNGVNIATGTARSGNTSNWAMRVSAVTSQSSNGTDTPIDTTPQIANGFSSYSAVPSDYTKVAYLSSVTDLADATTPNTGSSVTTTYQIYVSPVQPYGEYSGQVKYTMVHPAPGVNDANTLGFMQNVATWGSGLTANTPVQVADKRDGQIYSVAKLADNNIWMIDSLNLAGGTKLEGTLSDVPTTYPNEQDYYYQLPASSTTGFDTSTAGGYVYNSAEETCGVNVSCDSYYSWTAATAGAQGSSESDASYSICPKGWHLPTKTEFAALATALGGSNNITNYDSTTTPTGTTMYGYFAGAPDFVLSGYYANSAFASGGASGLYWAATAVDASNSYAFSMNSTNVNTASSAAAGTGYAVRCVAD